MKAGLARGVIRESKADHMVLRVDSIMMGSGDGVGLMCSFV